MKFYLAPMEGITGYIYRNAYEKYFHNVDRYYTPFIIPNQSRKFKTRELTDILPENNKAKNVIPQILTNDAEGFIHTATRLKEFGYEEVNLNLGCPSSTVVTKFRGSGFLSKREELDRFLDEIFKMDIKISIKTRIGKDSPDEFYELIKIYNKYPLAELIIHPRTREDFYGNKPNLEVFKDAVKLSSNPLCYNGDIFTKEDYDNITKEFKDLEAVMLGRGIIANPGLMNEIKDGKLINKQLLKEFHDEIVEGYVKIFDGDRNVLFKMKELWAYMIHIFSDNKKYAKQIKKSQNLRDYKSIVSGLFRNQEIIEGEGLFSGIKKF
ncbi:tRNA-U20a,U20b-dihydrouridine synthase [Clostridium sp. DSM 8431]|uniref:tRNA dihydrouridine synthase n=1 Tax=Clostridium sp. DSM 8431 TaxID=1761781 RepID=UPI0008E468C2|nr:tRNA-dihydrouridine synthase family protein [Clostridium sp. DSM 8431]SFU88973.1 tRNA-U20a,U20b-dihydrouridine synthase [Clostridium sp. DSM 8431]